MDHPLQTGRQNGNRARRLVSFAVPILFHTMVCPTLRNLAARHIAGLAEALDFTFR
jgi:hypothetical protein